MSLSRQVQNTALGLLSDYFQALYSHPLRTKAMTSAVISSLANISSQYVSGKKSIDWKSVRAYALFGLLVGGPVPHYFYLILDKLIKSRTKQGLIGKLVVERLAFAPFYQYLVLYVLAVFEGKSHTGALAQVDSLYEGVLEANWRWLTLPQFLNLWFVPPMMRVLVFNLIGYFWAIFIATKRRREAAK